MIIFPGIILNCWDIFHIGLRSHKATDAGTLLGFYIFTG